MMNDTMTIIQDGFLFTGDSHRRSGAFNLLIRSGKIAEISAHGDRLRIQHPSAEVIDAKGKIVLPGFVDAHVHGEAFLLRHKTAGNPLARWDRDTAIGRARSAVYQHLSAEELKRCYELAYFAALRAGVTAIAEYGFDRLDVPFVAAAEAFRRTDLRGVIGVHNGEQADAARRLKEPRLRFAMVLPPDEDLTTYSLQTTLRIAREERWAIMMSLGETRRAFEAIRKNFQRSVVQLAEEYRLFAQSAQILHLAHFEPGDLELLAQAKAPVIIGPASLLGKSTDVPPLGDFLRLHIPIALGTDWDAADPLNAVHTFVVMVRMLGLPVPRAEELLAMLTSIPARSLGLLDEVGTIEQGKRADLVFIDANDFRFGGLIGRRPQEVLFEILLHTSSDRITDVMVEGEFFVRDGHILTIAQEDLTRDARRLAERIWGAQPSLDAEPSTVERNLSGTPILHPQMDDIPTEEGFRVVRRGDAAAKILPMTEGQNSSPELSRNVRRTFGEEEAS